MNIETPSVGLIVRRPWIRMIEAGEKSWEMRSQRTSRRGPVALIEAGTGRITGVATITGVHGPLDRDAMLANCRRHGIDSDVIHRGEADKWRFAWEMTDARALARPVRYNHPAGAVVWVRLDEASRAALAEALALSLDDRPAPRKRGNARQPAVIMPKIPGHEEYRQPVQMKFDF